MKLVSIDTIPGKNYEVLGIVKGTIVQTKNIGRDFMAGMKTIVGGEIVGYKKGQRLPVVHETAFHKGSCTPCVLQQEERGFLVGITIAIVRPELMPRQVLLSSVIQSRGEMVSSCLSR